MFRILGGENVEKRDHVLDFQTVPYEEIINHNTRVVSVLLTFVFAKLCVLLMFVNLTFRNKKSKIRWRNLSMLLVGKFVFLIKICLLSVTLLSKMYYCKALFCNRIFLELWILHEIKNLQRTCLKLNFHLYLCIKWFIVHILIEWKNTLEIYNIYYQLSANIFTAQPRSQYENKLSLQLERSIKVYIQSIVINCTV